jgi:hypothetical protein
MLLKKSSKGESILRIIFPLHDDPLPLFPVHGHNKCWLDASKDPQPHFILLVKKILRIISHYTTIGYPYFQYMALASKLVKKAMFRLRRRKKDYFPLYDDTLPLFGLNKWWLNASEKSDFASSLAALILFLQKKPSDYFPLYDDPLPLVVVDRRE